MSDENFLSRWSRKKTEAKTTSPAGPDRPAADVVPAQAGTQSPERVDVDQAPAPLPPVESLTPESDFTPFMQADVDAGTKRAALKVLLSDPRFNVMDGLDVYIDDYSKPDPLPEGWLEKMNQVARLGIFKEPAEPAKEAAADAAALEKPPLEQRLEAVPAAAPAPPADAEIHASERGESSSRG